MENKYLQEAKALAFRVDMDGLPYGTAVYAQIADDFLNGN